MDKKIVMLGMVFGSTIGAYLPTFFGSEVFSFSSVIGTFIGGIIGIWLAFKLVN